MNAKPLRRYGAPAYPTRLQVLSNPELLERHLPPGWRAMPEMAGTVALLLAVNSSVQAGDKQLGGAVHGAAIVTSIFEHGEGRGAVGCIVIAPPVFLSEEEAWQVIDEELGRQKLKLPVVAFEIEGVKISQQTERYSLGKDREIERQVEERPGTAKAFKADRADPEKRIALEFVSQHDYHRLGGPFSTSTVQSYDLKAVAKSVAEKAAKQGKGRLHLGVLYDPVARMDPPKKPKDTRKSAAEMRKSWQESAEKSKAESQRLLRLQVQDFLKWLQAQGTI